MSMSAFGVDDGRLSKGTVRCLGNCGHLSSIAVHVARPGVTEAAVRHRVLSAAVHAGHTDAEINHAIDVGIGAKSNRLARKVTHVSQQVDAETRGRKMAAKRARRG